MKTLLISCRVAVACILAFAFAGGRSFAFGPVGHETIAYIAEDRLTPSTLKKLNDLLGHDDDLASIANWGVRASPLAE